MIKKFEKAAKDYKKLKKDLEALEDQAQSLELLIDQAEKQGRINWSLYREREQVEKRIGNLKAQLKGSED